MVPAGVEGLTTSSGTWLEAEPSSSSQVRKITVLPPVYEGEARIFANHDFSHASPVATEQSWVSLQRFGVTKEKAGSALFVRALRKVPDDVVPSGTSQSAQSERMPL